MCGIAGLFSTKDDPRLADAIVSMTQLVRHRGPDDEGYVLFSSKGVYEKKQSKTQPAHVPARVALGHRRLSIVDLSPAGHQPFCDHEGRYWITYNGEVYNYIELRKELEELGCHFHSTSDTEVILEAYRMWGRGCLSRFNGMFGLVIYDSISRKVFAARDRFGVKPLYMWMSPEGLFAVASEIKQFTVLPGWQAKLNSQCAYDFLAWEALDHTSETLFSGVRQLRGGEFLEFELEDLYKGMPKPSSWYSLEPLPFQGTFSDAAAQFADLLADAVRLRLRADVDVGSCLSGGLDSSAIVCLANRMLREDHVDHRQKTFSACSHVKKFDERNFIDIVVAETGVESFYTYPSLEDLMKTSEEIVWHQDEPFSSTSMYAQWMVFQLVKENRVKVMLDGQGADEQLAGYHNFFGTHFYDLFRSLQWGRLFNDIRHTKRLHGKAQAQAGRRILNQMLPELIRNPLRRALGKSSGAPPWLDINGLDVGRRQDPFLEQKRGSLASLSHLQITRSSLPKLLHWEDRDSMAHSIESRTPFLDYRLVEFVQGLPSDYKLSHGITKRVMREGMRGILPESIRSRVDKIGFATPEEHWITRQDPQLFCREVQQAVDASQGLIRPEVIDEVKKIIDGKKEFSFMVWRMLSFGQWMRRFSVSK